MAQEVEQLMQLMGIDMQEELNDTDTVAEKKPKIVAKRKSKVVSEKELKIVVEKKAKKVDKASTDAAAMIVVYANMLDRMQIRLLVNCAAEWT